MNEEGPDIIAAVDQWSATVKQYARVMRSYYEALMAEGFNAEQALALTLAYQSRVVGG